MKRLKCIIVMLLVSMLCVTTALAECCPYHPDNIPIMFYYDDYESTSSVYHRKISCTLFNCSECGYAWTERQPGNLFFHEETNGSSSHYYIKTNTTHTLVTITQRVCNKCEYVFGSVETQGSPEAHIGSINNWYDAGHDGAYHNYDSDCTKCGRRFRWRRILCPGGNNHVGPSGFNNPSETE